MNRVVLARALMRTRFEIVLAGRQAPAFLRAAGEEALDEIARVEADLSPFQPGSALARANREAARAPVPIDGVVLEFLIETRRLAAATGGAFDPTVGALTWPLRSGKSISAPARARSLACVGFARNVHIDAEARTVSFARPGVRLDPGAAGKGFALDRAAAVLREAGVTTALLHGGTSSVLGLGAPPGTAGWRVAVGDPRRPGRRLAYVVLRDRALGVSAPGARLFHAGGRAHAHVLDPRTGRPVARIAASAAACDSALAADALSTALLVATDAQAEKCLARFPGASLLVVRA